MSSATDSMKRWPRNHFWALLLVGLLAQPAGLIWAVAALRGGLPGLPAGLLLAAGGSALLVWGCWYDVAERGCHGGWALLGALHLPGMAALGILLHDFQRPPLRGFQVLAKPGPAADARPPPPRGEAAGRGPGGPSKP